MLFGNEAETDRRAGMATGIAQDLRSESGTSIDDLGMSPIPHVTVDHPRAP